MCAATSNLDQNPTGPSRGRPTPARHCSQTVSAAGSSTTSVHTANDSRGVREGPARPGCWPRRRGDAGRTHRSLRSPKRFRASFERAAFSVRNCCSNSAIRLSSRPAAHLARQGSAATAHCPRAAPRLRDATHRSPDVATRSSSAAAGPPTAAPITAANAPLPPPPTARPSLGDEALGTPAGISSSFSLLLR